MGEAQAIVVALCPADLGWMHAVTVDGRTSHVVFGAHPWPCGSRVRVWGGGPFWLLLEGRP